MENFLFIEKLPLSVTASDLTSLFSMAGTVRWTRVLTLASHAEFSCGIVEMASPEAATAALALLDLRRHFGVRLSIEPLFSPAALCRDDHSVGSGRA
jgi:RNA recognition motif-containing protein